MRGKVPSIRKDLERVGITPAYAGKSGLYIDPTFEDKDHPRVCGEKDGKTFGISGGAGITPAYAGKSLISSLFFRSRQDHPRVCGEKSIRCNPLLQPVGSPPRMRGKAARAALPWLDTRITPAYAGKSQNGKATPTHDWDHPRVCGEKTKKIP